MYVCVHVCIARAPPLPPTAEPKGLVNRRLPRRPTSRNLRGFGPLGCRKPRYVHGCGPLGCRKPCYLCGFGPLKCPQPRDESGGSRSTLAAVGGLCLVHATLRPECIDACSRTCGLIQEVLQANTTKGCEAVAARSHEGCDVLWASLAHGAMRVRSR